MFHVEQINKSRKMFYVEQSRGEQKRALWPFETVEKVAFSHFFDILWDASHRVPFMIHEYQIKCGAKSYIK